MSGVNCRNIASELHKIFNNLRGKKESLVYLI